MQGGWSRRHMVRGLPLAAIAMAMPRAAHAVAPAGLQARAAAKGLLYGAAITSLHLKDEAFTAALIEDCGLIVTEWEGQWATIEPRRGQPDFRGLDRLVEFCGSHGLKFRGHAGIWYKRVAPWFNDLPPAEAEAAMLGHIAAKLGRHRGRAYSWDVLNEAVDMRDGRPDGLRRAVLLDKFGPGYIDQLFHAARAADPGALLSYNDYGIEYDNDYCRQRRRAILALLQGMKARGVPVDAFGVQAHLRLGEKFNERLWSDWLGEVSALGLKIIVSELDVTDASGPADIAERDRLVAAEYARFLAPTLDNRAVAALLTWGLADRYSWIVRGTEPSHKRADGLAPRPLPRDQDLRPKPAWTKLAQAFDAAPPR